MDISVGNAGVASLEVSINKWHGDGDTSYFNVTTGDPETWHRTDSRGYVMAIKRNGEESKYYVTAGSSITISEDNVIMNGEEIQPVG